MVPIGETTDRGASRRVTAEQVVSILRGGFTDGMRKIGTTTNSI